MVIHQMSLAKVALLNDSMASVFGAFHGLCADISMRGWFTAH